VFRECRHARDPRPVAVRALLPAARLLIVAALLVLAGSATARDAPMQRLARTAEIEGVRLDRDALARFYAARGDAPAWTEERARALVHVLDRADEEGLRPDDYRPEVLAGLLAKGAGPEVELLASQLLLGYLDHLRNGRVSPTIADPHTYPPEPREDVVPRAVAIAGSTDLEAALVEAAPGNPYYRRLRRALAAHRALAEDGGWPMLPEGPTLRTGDSDPRVSVLRERLVVTGELGREAAHGQLFDEVLERAVRDFQRRHGLLVDGLVGPMTRRALNVDAHARVRQIVANMERWRWMPDSLGRRYVLVNLPGFDLSMVEDGAQTLRMRAIVGREYRRTPVFSDRISYLEVNPYWNVPDSIARNDILPRVRQNPAYLREQGIRVLSDWSHEATEIDPRQIDWDRVSGARLPFRFRQDPGPLNALGTIKFMFPNRFAVYLHDTPTPELFDRAVRTFSSGCIRVERPYELAARLLAGTGLDSPEAVRDLIATGRTRSVRLPEPVPVHLVYATAWLGDGGVMQFRDDVYGRDEVLVRALLGPIGETRDS
jgi:L,D-transpeptidase YcbB